LLAIIAAIGYGYFRRGSYYRNNRIPPAALHALESDSNLVLYSLYPDKFVHLDNGDVQPLPDNELKFRGYRILGQTALTSGESRHVVVNTVRDAVRNWDGVMALCFEPRHGVQATDATGTYDFLICFACRQVYVFSPGDTRKQLGIHASGQPLNDILTEAHVPLPTR
jgi:hypothetical protein